MKVFIINVTAQYGSTGKIAQILKEGYEQDGHQVTICYGRKKTEITEKGTYYQVSNMISSAISYLGVRLLGLQGLGCFLSTIRFVRFMKREQPDMVHILNLHGYYIDEFMLWKFLKSKGIPVIYTMCDEYPFTGKCGFAVDCDKYKDSCKGCEHKTYYPPSLFFNTSHSYNIKKRKIYEGYKQLVFAGCGYVARKSKSSSLLKDMDVRIIGEPVDMDTLFYPRDTKEIRNKLNIEENKIVILAVAVLSNKRKGGEYFLRLCEQLKSDKRFAFVYVGYNTDKYDAITPKEVIRIPYVESLDELAVYFSLADLYVATSLAETVPLAVVNSLACGTPVCAFDIGGMSSIDIYDNTIVNKVPVYDVDKLVNVVSRTKKKSNEDIEKNRNAIYDSFSSKKVVKAYNNIAKQIVVSKDI